MNQSEKTIATLTKTCRIQCPECAESRKKKHPPTLSITVNATETLYFCHHCEFKGCITHSTPINSYPKKPPRPKVTPIPTQLNHDAGAIQAFFSARGISIHNMSVMPPMAFGKKYFHAHGEDDAVGFVYSDAVKWRAVNGKCFTQDGAAREFYGLEQLDPDDETLIIVEGEADVIALASLSPPIRAVSCPNGAPAEVSKGRVQPEADGKFGYVWKSRDLLERMTKVILAVDQDEAGSALKEELARRIGRAKCHEVVYPEGCKDITDVLKHHGLQAGRDAIDKSQPMPLAGVYGAKSYAGKLLEVYLEGHGHGESTGYEVIDKLFTVKEGLLYVVTGMPSSGKSEFVDQVMMNLAQNSHWKFAVASFENPPHIHLAKLAEKRIGKPFFEGLTPRMTKTELDEATEFIDEHFCFLESKDGNLPTIRSILNRTRQAIMRLGCRGLVIDPYNYIQHEGEETEHQQINALLTKLVTFAQAHEIAIFFIAHPAKMQPKEDGTYPVPKGMNISGSASFFSKADIGLTVHRGENGVEIHNWKSRFKWIGEQGMAYLGYDIPTGRYFETTATQRQDAFADNMLGAPRVVDWGDSIDLSDLDF